MRAIISCENILSEEGLVTFLNDINWRLSKRGGKKPETGSHAIDKIDSNKSDSFDLENMDKIKLENLDNASLDELEICMIKDILGHIPEESVDHSVIISSVFDKVLKFIKNSENESNSAKKIEFDINKINKEILEAQCAASHQRIIARNTFICSVYDDETKTWGIVTRSNDFTIKFRLRNPYSKRLQHACETLVKALQSADFRRYSKKKDESLSETKSLIIKKPFNAITIGWKRTLFRIHPTIDILEKRSDVPSYHGIVRNRNFLKTLYSEYKFETIITFTLFILFVSLLGTTVPRWGNSGISFLEQYRNVNITNPSRYDVWLENTFDRLTSAIMVTTGVSFVELVFKALSIRKESPIKWTTEKETA